MNNSHIYGAVTTWDINKANSLLRSQDGNSICIHLVQSSLNKNMFIAESEERFFFWRIKISRQLLSDNTPDYGEKEKQ